MTQSEKALEVLERIKFDKHRRKAIKAMFKEALEQNGRWVAIKEEFDKTKARLKQAEMAVLADYKSGVEELERLNLSIKDDTQLLSDITLTILMKGEEVRLEDAEGKRYEAHLKVDLKQLKLF